MKNFIFVSVAFAVLSFSLPQTVSANKAQHKYAVTQEKEVKYQEIPVAEIPEAVTQTLAKDYAGYSTEKAFKGDDGTFKIVVKKDEMKEVLIFNDKGEVTKVEVPDAMK